MNTAKRRAYQEKADAELRAWNARIDHLRAKAEAKKAEGKIEFYERVEKLREQSRSVADQLAELKETTGDAWDEVRRGFERAHYELSTAFHSAFNRFGDDDDSFVPPRRQDSSAETTSAGS